MRLVLISKTVASAALSKDGDVAVTGNMDGSLCIWQTDPVEKRHEVQLNGSHVHGVAFSPDGSLVAAGLNSGEAALIEVKSGNELRRLERHTLDIHSICFSPDGSRIATGVTLGKEAVKIWDTASGQELMTCPTERGYTFRQIAFSPNGYNLVTLDLSKRLHMWRAPEIGRVSPDRTMH